jgi:2-hydroxychromene-2-carboxylate isomerase
VPLVLEPKYFPVDSTVASKLIIAVQQTEGDAAAFKLSGALMAAVWSEERDIADKQILAAVLGGCGLSQDHLTDADSQSVQATFDKYTQSAIDLGVFGAPTYVVDGEMFWGQDRLMFVAQALQRA